MGHRATAGVREDDRRAQRERRGARARWALAIESIRAPARSPAYDGLAIAPQLGLLPIGQDPESGLWEFADLATGEPAERDPNGRIALKESTGVVFVLIPGGHSSWERRGMIPWGITSIRIPKRTNHLFSL